MNKKIIFLDVDGTLTLPTGEVSYKVKNAISQARNNGHYVFLCTGRNKAVYVHYYLLGLMVRFVVLEVILKLLVKKFMSLV